ncbi:MAG: DUF3127 domain-containing protein [Lentisphaeraceae bacterium]|nr:DUF3127 domain-containing protein [Lentisphaeraceae bacterium]
MQINGKILEILDTVQISESFKKREFVVEYQENQYPEFIKFELVQDKCSFLDQYAVGSEVTVDFNLKGRKWTNPQGEVKYFNSLQAWRITAVQNEDDHIPAQEGEMPPPDFDTDLQEEVPF